MTIPKRITEEAFRAARSLSARSAAIYVVSLGVTLGLPFLILPVMANHIQPTGYGKLSMLQAFITFSAIGCGFGLRNPLFRSFSVHDDRESASYLSACLVIMAAVFLLLVTTAILARAPIQAVTGVSMRWTLLALSAGLCTALCQTQMTIMQAQHRALSYAMAQICFSFLAVGASLLMVVVLNWFWVGRALAVCGIALLSGAWACYLFWRRGMLGHATRSRIWNAFLFGAALIPFSTATVALGYIDRFALSSQYSLAVVGVYAIAAHLAQGFMSLISGIHLAISPWLFGRLKVVRSDADFRRLLLQGAIVCGFIVVAAVAFYFPMTLVVPLLFPPAYQASMAFFPWLMAGAVCNALFPIFNGPLLFYERRRLLGLLGLVTLAFSICVIFYGAHVLGPVGAAIGVFISRLTLLVVTVIFCGRVMRTALRQAPTGDSISPPELQP